LAKKKFNESANMISLMERYRHKIKTAEQLRAIIGPPPRKKRVIMCHGVFDVVHPGHIRHLLYAKSKADLLVASITADKHITKGVHRPHVTQDLRAVNLAAFEMVDYVIIDRNDTPLANIETIQPDYFAKGFEYNAKDIAPRTAEEAAIVEAYGGELIFTPGDIVYSSSALINLAPPSVKMETLQILMEGNDITFDRLRDVLSGMPGQRVHIVGDTIVDSYTQCAMIGGQTKTPTMSVLYERRIDYVGGAGVVAKHLVAAGAKVTFSTVLGDDAFKTFAIDDMRAAGINMRAVIDPSRPTVNKNAIVVDGYRLLKVDTLDNRSISDNILASIADAVSSTPADAVVYSDFRHGLFNRRTLPELIKAIPPGVYRVADSQVASRWGNITEFTDFDMITPNEREARFALADQDSGIRPLASVLYDTARCKLLILKLGERGILACRDRDHESLDSFFVIDSFVDRVVDAVGAGDALLAYSTLAMLISRNDAVATILGAFAAACECECDGNIPITPDNVRAKIAGVERQMNFA
jgi:rfaE bifunctional protein nucleotidyltransferase chain/domain